MLSFVRCTWPARKGCSWLPPSWTTLTCQRRDNDDSASRMSFGKQDNAYEYCIDRTLHGRDERVPDGSREKPRQFCTHKHPIKHEKFIHSLTRIVFFSVLIQNWFSWLLQLAEEHDDCVRTCGTFDDRDYLFIFLCWAFARSKYSKSQILPTLDLRFLNNIDSSGAVLCST